MANTQEGVGKRDTGDGCCTVYTLTRYRVFRPFVVRCWQVFFQHPINFDFSIDYKQLYAQAWNLILNGFRYYFNSEENSIVEQHNQHYMETDADMELFYEYYRKPEGEEEGIFLSAAKLAEHIKSKTGIAISKKMIWKLGRNQKASEFS